MPILQRPTLILLCLSSYSPTPILSLLYYDAYPPTSILLETSPRMSILLQLSSYSYASAASGTDRPYGSTLPLPSYAVSGTDSRLTAVPGVGNGAGLYLYGLCAAYGRLVPSFSILRAR
eukprot:1072449-Rhodomonas_salina.1